MCDKRWRHSTEPAWITEASIGLKIYLANLVKVQIFFSQMKTCLAIVAWPILHGYVTYTCVFVMAGKCRICRDKQLLIFKKMWNSGT